MTLFIEYPDTANAIGHGRVTPDVRAALQEQMQLPEISGALSYLLTHVGYTRVCVQAVDENGVGFHMHDPSETVVLDVGRDVLESDDIGAYMAFLPYHVHHMLDTTTTDEDSDDDGNPDANAPMP